jgi:hypothetical protein
MLAGDRQSGRQSAVLVEIGDSELSRPNGHDVQIRYDRLGQVPQHDDHSITGISETTS